MNYSRNMRMKRRKHRRNMMILTTVVTVLLCALMAMLFMFAISSWQDQEQMNVVEADEITISTPIPIPTITDLGLFKLTAYCPCEACCGKSDGITKSGEIAVEGVTVAVDPDIIPLGTKIIIDGHCYIAQDTGSAIKGNRIDVFFNSHQDALDFGVQHHEVYRNERS